jgi:hypothetical protein
LLSPGPICAITVYNGAKCLVSVRMRMPPVRVALLHVAPRMTVDVNQRWVTAVVSGAEACNLKTGHRIAILVQQSAPAHSIE